MENNNIHQQLRAMTDGLDEWCIRQRQRSKRRTTILNTTILASAVVAILLVLVQPVPDGLYVSDRNLRDIAMADLNGTANRT